MKMNMTMKLIKKRKKRISNRRVVRVLSALSLMREVWSQPQTRKLRKGEIMDNIIYQVRSLVETAEKFRNSYWFTPPTSASGRRSYEKHNSIDSFEWDESGHHFSASFTVSCSCRNVYTTGEYYKDGKKTTLTAIKNSLHRMEEAKSNGKD